MKLLIILLWTSIVVAVRIIKHEQNIVPYIFGGRNASNGDAPWQVSIRYLGEHFCGGSIIAKRWIVTSASCIDDYKERYENSNCII